MSFSFNFLPDSEGDSVMADPDQAEAPSKVQNQDTAKENQSFKWIQNQTMGLTYEDFVQKKNSTGESITLLHDSSNDAVNHVLRVREESSSFRDRNTDLVPGVYEGGLKVWECSIDLCRYFVQKNIVIKGHILELGCGHGLPGIWLLKQAISKSQQSLVDTFVTFSDYNEFVIRDVTIPNVAININDSCGSMNNTNHINHLLNGNAAFGSGDWLVMSDLLLGKSNSLISHEQAAPPAVPKDGLFDCILASETTYSESAANETAELLSKHLKPGTGVAFISSKRYYFGVGGGTKCLCESLRKQNKHEFQIEVLEVYDNGAGNIRELLLVKSLGIKG